MAKDRIEQTIIIFDESEVHQLLEMAQRADPEEIQNYMMKVFIKKIEAYLRRRC